MRLRFRLALAAVGMLAVLAAPPAFAGKDVQRCPDKTAATKGSSATAYALGKAYDAGTCGLPYDAAEAARWYRKAAEKGLVSAQYALGEVYFSSGKDYPEAKKWFLKAADQGDGPSELRLGYLNAEAHYEGLTPDYAEAEKWFTKAAEKNVEDAQFRLGNFYANYKQPRDYDKAYLWLKKAAEGGNRTAMFDLANLIRIGKAKEKSEVVALKWMTAAAEAGVVGAQTALIEMYSTGRRAPQDTTKALKWILKLADDPQASNLWLDRAGDVFFSGWLNIPAHYPTAIKYYERAAAKGDPHARGRLGEMYAEGLGVSKDPEKAKEYFKGIPPLLPGYDKRAAEINDVPRRTIQVPVIQKH